MKLKRNPLLLMLIVLLIGGEAFGQTDPAAKSILDKVGNTYSSYKTIVADFTLNGHNSVEKSDFNEKGRVYLAPGTGNYKIETPQHALISDGKTQWTVLLDIGEVQVTDVNPNDKSLSPTNIFFFYRKGYSMKKLKDAVAGGQALYAIELKPDDNTQNISRIVLRVNKSSSMIYDASVFDKNGNTYTYTLKNIETNKTFSPGIFQFYKHNYPGVEIVDLR